MKKLFLLLLLALPLGALLLNAGSPAARQVDTTTHGGTIVSGSPNVFCNGRPLAMVGSLQTCPQVQAVPHVGGPITTGSSTVFVNGASVATLGSAATCNFGGGPTIAQGSPNVIVGN